MEDELRKLDRVFFLGWLKICATIRARTDTLDGRLGSSKPFRKRHVLDEGGHLLVVGRVVVITRVEIVGSALKKID
jgi:hypothetical protein